MIIRAKKLETSWDYVKGKILTTKKAKKIFQYIEKGEKEILIGICFNKKVVQMLIMDLRIYI